MKKKTSLNKITNVFKLTTDEIKSRQIDKKKAVQKYKSNLSEETKTLLMKKLNKLK